jgi:tellurite methyltransferase
MPSPAETWDSRYSDPAFHPAPQPNPFLIESLPFLPRGCALDLACGAGQNAVALVERGWPTAAVDISLSALDRAETLAHSHHLPLRRASAAQIPREFPSSHAELFLIRADLEKFTLPGSAFDVILCFRYLQRSLFPAIERALRPGGVLVFETFTLDQLSFDRGPRNPQHLLQPGELHDAFPGLVHIFSREWKSSSAASSAALQGSTPAQGGSPGQAVNSGEALASLLARKK